MFRKIPAKPVQVAPATVVALNELVKDSPFFFRATSRGNLQFFRKYDLGGGHTCPRQEVEAYMQYVLKMPLERAIDRTFIALARGPVGAQA